MLNKAGLSKAYTHHVSVPEDGTYSITDDSREVEWVAGVPRVSASASRQVGRVKEFGVQKVWAFDENGQFGKVVDYRFNSEEGRDLVTTDRGQPRAEAGARHVGEDRAVGRAAAPSPAWSSAGS